MKTLTVFFMLFCSCSLFAQNKGINFPLLEENHIVTPDNPVINIINNFTLEFWMQPTKISGNWLCILADGKCNNDSFSYYVAISPDSVLYFRFSSDGVCNSASSYVCNNKINPGMCYHVAIIYSLAGVKIYLNGILQLGHFITGSYSGNLFISNEPFVIGAYKFLNGTYGSWYYGILDEVRVWGRVLSPSEILANYQDTLQ